MKLSPSVIAISLSLPSQVAAFTQSNINTRWGSLVLTSSTSSSSSPLSYVTKSDRTTSLPSLAVAETDEALSSSSSSSNNSEDVNDNYLSVNKLGFRDLQRECKEKGLPATGNTAALRGRLLEALGVVVCDGSEEDVEECVNVDFGDVSFVDESDPDFDNNALLAEVEEKAQIGHWKAATRKLKKLNKKMKKIPSETYIAVLESCLQNKLQGARASEPARKILEEMSANGYQIPKSMGNQCVLNSLGNCPDGTHDGFGGIDTALAMLAAMESSPRGSEIIAVDTYGSVVSALCKDGAVDEALLLLRAMVVEHSFTPSLSTFADVAKAAVVKGESQEGESVLQVMTLAKASGYVLDNIASAVAGRDLLASGVIAAEKMNNLALGLRFLTAASKAEGCLPDRGDDLVASSSSAAQRACMLIHRRAIDKAVQDDNWKLAVKLLALMRERSLSPATSVWRKVVTVCAKAKKSKRATATLLDWIEAAEEEKVEIPPINVFNSVVNACESVKEEELTLTVLETMKKLYGNSGNIVTTNIALKRLAKLGNTIGCEGLIISMLEENVEPTVVTYTTAIGACVQANDSAMAVEWVRRMRSRNVMPNFHTYNTALASCLDGKLESTIRASAIATEMYADVNKELDVGLKGNAEFNSVIPDSYTKVLARSLMKQLRDHWRADEINMKVAKATIRVPLLKLVDFERSEAAKEVQKRKAEREEAAKKAIDALEDDISAIESSEAEVDVDALREMVEKRMHKRMEV